ncbi:MAG TPA: iron-containing redox enzyme family protein [Kofleriaceae bacterium]|jgi:pyrroloquinoline quinone (PQQ) biosynthesis protein C|nr:iron-containing redox enzyme family protein [Kofleriaceae bacterium]
MQANLRQLLMKDRRRTDLVDHRFFAHVRNSPDLDRTQVARFLGQWWHPLHFFPTFLSRLISNLRDVEMKTAVSKILWEELGEGDPARAHERIYVTTMTTVGFAAEEVHAAPPLPTTERLVQRYSESAGDCWAGLGFLYGTEVADLAMVSGIGVSVRRVTGEKQLPWVTIHARQEPGHIDSAQTALPVELSEVETHRILDGAREMWSLWVAFFDALDELATAAPGRTEGRPS